MRTLDFEKGGYPVLMYHDIVRDAGAAARLPLERRHYALPAELFSDHLRRIRSLGLRTLTAEEMESAAAGVPGVVLTFDDGHSSQFEQAFPLLQKFGMKATFFIVPEWIGRKGFMGWDQVKELVRSGMSVQSHTMSHQFLIQLVSKQMVDELRGSKEIIEAHTGRAVRYLSLPGGRSEHSVWQLAAAFGYRGIFTSSPGYGSFRPFWQQVHRNGYHPRAYHRFAVSRKMDADRLERLLLCPWSAFSVELRLKYLLGKTGRTLMGNALYDRLWLSREKLCQRWSLRRKVAMVAQQR